VSRRRSAGDQAARRERTRLVADVLRHYWVSPFQFEGAVTAGLRAELCLRGWPWELADTEARRLVKAALALIGARRPTWQQGQPEHTQEGATYIPRDRCARCTRRLPEGRPRYCSDVCHAAAWADRCRSYHEQYGKAVRAARRAAWRRRMDP
jgi:hypothetical protein